MAPVLTIVVANLKGGLHQDDYRGVGEIDCAGARKARSGHAKSDDHRPWPLLPYRAYRRLTPLEVEMIEVLQDVPAGVVGIRVSGRVTADDFQEFKPILDQMLASDEIRFIEIIGPDYEGFSPGGLLADVKQGFSTLQHLRAFKRTAVVTDKEWIEHTLHALAWMIPGEVALFGLDQLDAAKQWAAS